MEIWHIWIIVAVILLIVEIFTAGFAVVCFSIGALFSAIAAYFEMNVTWQIAFFAVGSLLSLIFIRPIILKTLHAKEKTRETNADALIGKEAEVVEVIDGTKPGRVKIDGDVWQGRSEDGTRIVEGETVVVTQRDSIILTVKTKKLCM